MENFNGFNFFLSIIILTFLLYIFYSFYQIAFNSISESELQTVLNDFNYSLSEMNTVLGVTINVLQCLFLMLFVVLFWKFFDKRPIKDIGLISIKKGYKDLIIGLALGAISLLLVFVILLATKSVTLTQPLNKPNINTSLITGLILFIFVGINEEMFARGYCMTVLKQTSNKYVVVIVSSLIFSAMHSLNPGMSLFSYINLFLFGLLTAYMTLKSENLWLAIGYHITWNYFQGNICGFLVSGQTTSSMYSLEIGSNSLINGGQFGPEGGIIVTFIILLNFLYLWKVYKPSYKVY